MTRYQADYQIAVIDPSTGELLDIVTQDRFIRLQYSRVLNDIGTLTLTINGDDSLVSLKDELDLILEVYRRNEEGGSFEVDDVYLLRYSDLGEVDVSGRETLILTGKQAAHLLARRVIVPEDDPTGAAGFSTKADDAQIVMYQYVNDQCVSPATNLSRIIPGFDIAPLSIATFFNTYQRRNQGDNLLSVLQDITNQQISPIWIDFWVDRLIENEFRVHFETMGRDMSYTANPFGVNVIFDPKRGNLVKPRLRIDRRDEKTVVYVAGQGVEEDRVYVEVEGGNSADSIFNRIELTTDNRSDDTLAGLLDSGNTALRENLPKTSLEFQPFIGASDSLYNIDWFLGDVVTAQYMGYSEDHRIIEVEIDLTADEKVSVKTKKWRA